MHLSSIILEMFKDRAFIIPEILEFIELHTYKFGLVYLLDNLTFLSSYALLRKFDTGLQSASFKLYIIFSSSVRW